MEIDDLLTMEFKVTIIKMLTKFRRMDEHSVNVNKVLENIKKTQMEQKL